MVAGQMLEMHLSQLLSTGVWCGTDVVTLVRIE